MYNVSVFQKIKDFLDSHLIEYKALNHEPTKTSKESAEARGEDLAVGGKGLVVKVNGSFKLFVLSASKKLDSNAIEKYFHVKGSRFATTDELMQLTGLVSGSVPPFGKPILGLELYVDNSIVRNQRIAFNAGSLTDSIIMSTADYLRIANPTIFDFSMDSATRDLDKFDAVASSYSEKFGFTPYYSALIELLEKYCDRVHCVLEIGAANGIVPQIWDKIRKVGEWLEYYSVDPSPKMVRQAKSVAETLSMRYHPTLGYIENALEVCGLMNKKLDLLILSRSLHEIYLGHGRDIEKVFSNLSKLIEQSNPDFVVIGDAERNTGLSQTETQRFIEQQAATIGHGHDPAIDYLDFSRIITFMCAVGYQFLDEKGVVQPLDGFEVSPWKFRIVAFEKS